jgi:Protein of unknown function (DUF3592)
MVGHPVYFIISVILLLVVAGFACQRAVFLQSARRIEGKVVGVTATDSRCGSRRSRHDCTRFKAHVKYTPPETGRDYTLDISAGSAYGNFQPLEKARLHTGESVKIAYNPQSPQTAYEDTFWGIWGTPVSIMIAQIVAFFSSLGEPRRKRSAFG